MSPLLSLLALEALLWLLSKFPYQMNAATSVSLHCKVGTKAVWLLYLGAKRQTNFGPLVKDKPNICQFRLWLYLGNWFQREEQNTIKMRPVREPPGSSEPSRARSSLLVGSLSVAPGLTHRGLGSGFWAGSGPLAARGHGS